MLNSDFTINSRDVRERIQNYLDKHQMTWQMLSDKTGIDPTNLSKFKTGRLRNLGTAHYFAIARALQISINELIYGEKIPEDRGLSRDEKFFMRDYRSLDEGDKEIIRKIVQRLKEVNAFRE